MEELRLGDQVVRFDKAATKSAYLSLDSGDADRCGCGPCRNFALQRTKSYPLEFMALLDRLGIDPMKEGEAFEYGPESSGKHLYGGWFYFVGIMSTAGQRQIENDTFSCFINNRFPKPPRPFLGQPVLALEFITRLPWLLEEPLE